tara:strand:- start:677 stop:1489 length:813 start_codon:yes stop_codon:yes gene_type:complete
MALTRIVYTHSGVDVDGATVETAQNATVTFNIPRENVNVFGKSGTVDRPQLDAADATLEFSMIPQDAGEAPGLTATIIDGYIDDSLALAPARLGTVSAAGVGEIKNALMSSVSCEASVGAMANMTLSFTGAPVEAVPGSAAGGAATAINLVSPKDVTLAGTFGTDCAQSAASAWDLPIESVLCLGNDPADPADVNTFGNPPGTASFTIEGLDSGLVYTAGSASYTVTIGVYAWTLLNGRVDSQTNSLAVGDVFGTFNYVIGGTADGFSVA